MQEHLQQRLLAPQILLDPLVHSHYVNLGELKLQAHQNLGDQKTIYRWLFVLNLDVTFINYFDLW